MLAIETRGLGRSFDGRVAVEGLDLEVRAGEVLGFLGPNGAAKTTTIRMLAGLISPTSGSATVCGVDVVARPDEVRRQIGLLTETPGLYERLSVWRNLVLFAELYGTDDPAGRVERWLKRMSLWERREDPAGSLSKGMRQKVALCRALLHDPAVVAEAATLFAAQGHAVSLIERFAFIGVDNPRGVEALIRQSILRA